MIATLISHTLFIFFFLVHIQEDAHLEHPAGCIHVTVQFCLGPSTSLFPKPFSNEPSWLLLRTSSCKVNHSVIIGKSLWILNFCWNAWLFVQPPQFRCYLYSHYEQRSGNRPANDLPIDPLTLVSQELRVTKFWLTLVARDKQTCYVLSSLPSYLSSVF